MIALLTCYFESQRKLDCHLLTTMTVDGKACSAYASQSHSWFDLLMLPVSKSMKEPAQQPPSLRPLMGATAGCITEHCFTHVS